MSFAPWEWLLSLLGNLLSFYYDLIPEYGIAIIPADAYRELAAVSTDRETDKVDEGDAGDPA